MRAREFLKEVNLDIPDQMVSVQIPLSAITRGSDQSSQDQLIINPGRSAGKDGKYKWSPPLQQQLDVVKAVVGPSNNQITAAAAAADYENSQDNQSSDSQHVNNNAASAAVFDLKNKIKAILADIPSMLG